MTEYLIVLFLIIILLIIVSIGLWYTEIKCIFYPHKMERSHPDSYEKCKYCNRDINGVHRHINKNIIS